MVTLKKKCSDSMCQCLPVLECFVNDVASLSDTKTDPPSILILALQHRVWICESMQALFADFCQFYTCFEPVVALDDQLFAAEGLAA